MLLSHHLNHTIWGDSPNLLLHTSILLGEIPQKNSVGIDFPIERLVCLDIRYTLAVLSAEKSGSLSKWLMIRHQLGICYELLCISWLLSGWLPGPPRLPTQPSPPTTHLPSHCICRPSAQRSSSSAKAQLSQAWTLLLKEIMSLATCQAGGITVEHHDLWTKNLGHWWMLCDFTSR